MNYTRNLGWYYSLWGDDMFTWLNKQGVQSDRGFIVQSVDRFTIEYREGSRKVSIHVESGRSPDGKLCEIISRGAFKRWDNDLSGMTNPLEKQQEMLQNFREAMEVID